MADSSGYSNDTSFDVVIVGGGTAGVPPSASMDLMEADPFHRDQVAL